MAYAVASLVEILEQDLHHLSLDSKNEIQNFLEKARSLRDLLLQSPCRVIVDELRILLIDAAHRAEDVIEDHIRNQILLRPTEAVSQLDLTELVQDFESIIGDVLEETADDDPERQPSLPIDHHHSPSPSQAASLPIGPATRNNDYAVANLGGGQWGHWTPGKLLMLKLSILKSRTKMLKLKNKMFKTGTQMLKPGTARTARAWNFPLVPPPGILGCIRRCDDVAVFEDDFQTLKARLIEGPFHIISLYGLLGKGKRTLARRLYNDPLVATHFGTRAWLSDPIEVNAKTCLLYLLDALGMLTSEMHRKTVDELKVYIQKALKNIRYFIVILNVVDNQNWVTFKDLFRDHGVGSRVLFTTYAKDDAKLPRYGEPYKMPFLTDSESWLLFSQKIFGRGDHCPDELEPIGKIIIGLCKGIPQAVSLIAGFLATSEKTPAAWEHVATTLSSRLEGVPIEGIHINHLILIYLNLPHYLKPCLLYVSAFYESRDIKASKIIKLWIAEGFVKQSAGECLEDVAEMYLNILIDKNLLSPTHVEPNGRITTFQLHLFLKFCYWSVADDDGFLGSKYLHDRMGFNEEKIARRVSSHGLFLPSNEMELPSFARSFLSISGASPRPSSIYLKLRLLRVLEVFMLEFYQFPIEIMQQVLLRYLSFSCHSNLPNSFSILRNLQTLIIRRLPAFRAFSLPPDLWGLTLLRHVKCKETFVLSHPTNGNEVVHGNLQTLSNMQLLGVTNQFLGQIPKIRNMGIFCNIAMETVFDLACLDKLETLKCSTDWSLASRNFLAYLTLPQSLRKLNLSLCRIPAEFMKVVGSLPNLELLKLQKSDFFGVNTAQSAPEWVPAEREFPQLVSLEMLDLNLVHWKANANHFPKLKHLVIRNCYAMMEIPLDIGNIQTLELIQVNKTSPSALVSAMQIKKEQEGRGNKCLEVLTFKVVV